MKFYFHKRHNLPSPDRKRNPGIANINSCRRLLFPRNGRLQQMAGIAISKMLFVSLQKKRFAKLQTLLFIILPVLPNHHSQGFGLVHWATWFDVKCFIKLGDIA